MGTAIATLLDADALSGDFVSMAAGMGPEVWAAVVQVYAATLEAQGRQAPTWATSHSKKRSTCKQQCREAVAAKDPEGPLRLAVTLTAHQAATLQTLMHTAWKAALCRGLQSVVSFHHEGFGTPAQPALLLTPTACVQARCTWQPSTCCPRGTCTALCRHTRGPTCWARQWRLAAPDCCHRTPSYR